MQNLLPLHMCDMHALDGRAFQPNYGILPALLKDRHAFQYVFVEEDGHFLPKMVRELVEECLGVHPLGQSVHLIEIVDNTPTQLWRHLQKAPRTMDRVRSNLAQQHSEMSI